MRKVLGASRKQVAIQFLSEAFLLVLIAMLFALVIVELVLPFYNDAIGRQLQLQLLSEPRLLLSLLSVVIVVGLGAGIYPALYISRYQPAYILAASKDSESNGTSRLRTSLVVFQFATSIALVVCTSVIFSQTHYANNLDVGYTYKDKLVLNINGAGDSLSSLKQELLNLPQINTVVFSSESPSQDNENNTMFKLLDVQDANAADQNQLLNYHNMGFGFFEAYNIKPLAGRLFDENYGADAIEPETEDQSQAARASVILNQSAIRKFGFTSPQQAIGKTLQADVGRNDERLVQLQIIGVIPDIYFRSIKFSVRPSVYMLNPERFRVASLVFNTRDLTQLRSDVERVWKQHVPQKPIEVKFLSEMIAAQYQSEATEAKLFTAFSMLAIVIACLGLYGLAAFTAQRRTMEIGLRKVMGAEVRDIVTLLIWQFSKPVILANVIAWPITLLAMSQWLEGFPYRIDSLWMLPLCMAAGLISIAIAWITVGGNAAKVARTNPIVALRHV